VTPMSERPKVVVALPLAQPLLDLLAPYDTTFLPTGRTGDGAFEAALEEADGVIVSSNVTVDRGAMESAPKLRVISTMSVGLDHIDVEAAKEKGIVVTITPVLSDAVADLTMALMTMLARRICEGMHAVANGGWSQGLLGADLAGKRLLLVGFGRIGQSVARRALAARMHVRYVDIRSQLAMVDDAEPVHDLASGLPDADFVSLHVDLNAETRNMMGRDQFKLMRPTAYLVNTSRGGVVDQTALTSALATGTIAGAALDVLQHEPPHPDDPLLKAPNVIIVPHIGSATRETRNAMAQCAVDNLLLGLRDERSPFEAT
jgi:glyoxylate reductase